MTNNIYDLHKAAFSNVSAYIVMKEQERIATIAFKYPKDGAGRLYCYLHIIGLEMVRDYAGGYGYDKHSAAFQHACDKIKPYKLDPELTHESYKLHADGLNALMEEFQKIAKEMGGKDWDNALRGAGYSVFQAV